MDAMPQSSQWAKEARMTRADPLAAELLAGLSCPQKFINPRFFYDEEGSRLFEQITRLPEYYPTRTEIKILQANAAAIARCVGTSPVVIEPGAGSCEKIRYLLDEMRPAAYVPQDISQDFLQQTARQLHRLYPWLKVYPLAGDFAAGIDLPEELPDNRRVLFYPGSTIGNLDPTEAVEFLRNMRDLVGRGGGVVLGVDLQKDPTVLNAAYNDAAGVTASFNRNALHHASRILGVDLAPEKFSHRAFYNREKHRIEMHLVSEARQRIKCQDTCLYFAEGETIHTESSYKYTLEGIQTLAQQAGFELAETWMDEKGWFSVNYLKI